MTIVSPTIPLAGIPPYVGTAPNITPFTYRDGLTYLEILEQLRVYIDTQIVPFVNTLSDDWVAQSEILIAAVNDALAAQDASVDAKILELTDYVDTAVEQIINDSIVVQDPVVAALFTDDESATRVQTDTLYAEKVATATALDALDTRVTSTEGVNTTQDATIAGLNVSLGNVASDLVDAEADIIAIDAELAGRLSDVNLNSKYMDALHSNEYGVIGNGVVDDAAALTTFLNAAATAGLPAVLEPGLTVLVDSTVTVPSKTDLFLNGSTIKRGPTGSSVLLQLLDKSDIRIGGGIIDGDKIAYAPVTEWRHNINLDNSHRITLYDLVTKNAKGDGVYVGGTVAATYCSRIRLNNVVSDSNHRQGLSIIAVDDLVATACQFINTSGTAPECGVDVEPNGPTQLVRGIKFVACVMRGNAGYGYLEVLQAARSVDQGYVQMVGCQLDANTLGGARLTESEGFTMLGGTASKNTSGPGILHNTLIAAKSKFVGVVFNRNGTHGMAYAAAFSDLAISECSATANGQQSTGDGFNITPAAASTNFRFIGNYSGDVPQRNGITTGPNVNNHQLIGNYYGGNTASRALSTPAILDLDQAGKPTVTGAKGGNVALGSLLTGLAAIGVLVNSTTA